MADLMLIYSLQLTGRNNSKLSHFHYDWM